MPKSIRIRTEPGIDKNINVKIDQDFDFLEILSLKLRQEDLYTRFCADYGVVVGRVIANGGYGVPNAHISVFVPIDEIDENDEIISTLYPYKTPTSKNEDGFRYNLLPYQAEYKGHIPTGTFPTRDDVLRRSEVLQVYEKYYKYTVRTNESGDFMIVGVPLGSQKVILDLDLSNMGCFSLRPQDLIRMNLGIESQFDGSQFKSSTDIDSLPQIIHEIKDIDVASFWGQDDSCDVGITRVDFDLRELGIEFEPTATFMGSIFSSPDNQMMKKNCKPKTEQGDLCGLVTGPGEILALRQTINIDANGDPILEQYVLPNGGKIIDDEGAFLTEVPMNLDYIYTNEFGEEVISPDGSKGIPTKAKYRFKIKYQSEENGPEVVDGIFTKMAGEIMRANYIVPQIREHGWKGNVNDPGKDPALESSATTESTITFNDTTSQIETLSVNVPNINNNGGSFEVISNSSVEKVEVLVNGEVRTEKWVDLPNGGSVDIRVTKIPTAGGNYSPVNINYKIHDYLYSQFIKSYAFSLDWGDYADKVSAIKCEDSFYEMTYNKVYTTAQLIEEFRKGSGRARFIGIKEILDRGCEGDTNKFPTNDGVRNFDFLFFVFNILISVLSPVVVVLIVILHLLALLWPILKWVLTVYLTGYLAYNAYQTGAAAVSAFPAVGLTIVYGIGALLLAIATGLFVAKVAPLIVKFNFKSFGLPMMSYPECLACECSTDDLSDDEITDGFPGGAEPDEGFKIRKYIVWDNGGSSILAPLNNPSTWNVLGGDPTDTLPIGVDPENYTVNPDKQNARYQADLFGIRYGLAGYPEPNSASYGAPITRWYSNGDKQKHSKFILSTQVTTAQSMNLMNVRSRYFKVTYNDIDSKNGQNIIQTKVNNNTPFTDSVLIMLVNTGSQLNQGDILTFNNVDNITDVNYSAATNPVNQFGSKSITATTQTNTTTTLKYIDEDGDEQTIFNFQLSASTTEKEYLFKTGVEYFQVIKSMSFKDAKNLINNNKGIISKHLDRDVNIPYYNPVTNSITSFTDDPMELISGSSDNFRLVFMVRGVDVWSPKQKIKYDLSKLFGYTLFNESISAEGDFYLNVPIQKTNLSNVMVPIDHNNSSASMFHKPFNFNVSTFTQVKTPNLQYYSSLNDGNKANNIITLDTTNQVQFNAFGGTIIFSDSTSVGPTSISNLNATVFSPRYSPFNVTISGTNPLLVMRSDRLPTSDVERVNNNNSMAFHLNPNFAIYKVGSDELSVLTQNPFDTNDIVEDYTEEYGNNTQINAVTSTFSCPEMVPLSCYKIDTNTNTITVDPDCKDNKDPERVVNGCYRLLEKPYLVGIGRDIGNFTEWKSRFRFTFGACRNVISLTFVNNWVNGSLYMYSFQKEDVYGNNPDVSTYLTTPDYVFCEDTVVFQKNNNSFFYRASPYNGSKFTGKEPLKRNNGELFPGQNAIMLGSPTTIMDMGPKDQFLQEVCFNPEYEGYIADRIASTSYKDVSDLLQTFFISRLTNTNFLQQLIGFGNASISSLFSRENQRLDGDLTQLNSINSEFGVTPFLGNNYPSNSLYFDINNDPNIGVFFSANTVNRDLITPGRITFADTTSLLANTYGFKDQEVPYHPWNIKSNNKIIFGTEQNDWQYKKTTNTIDTVKYQSIDRLLKDPTFPSDGLNPSTRVPGYIYNSTTGSTGNLVPDEYSTKNFNSNDFKLLVGAPYHFYFGLRIGKTAMNKFIDKYIPTTKL